MDYKELISHLKSFGAYYPITGPIENEAADAIETLLAERAALLSEIKGDCHFCAFEWGACVACEDGSKWEWRGPQKKEKED